MIYELKLKLTKAFLGAKKTHKPVRNLIRDEKHRVVVPKEQWQWDAAEAVATLGFLDVYPGCFLELLPFEAPTTYEYWRRYTKAGKKQAEPFEALRAGSVITAYTSVATRVPSFPTEASVSPSLRPPSQDEVAQTIQCIGVLYGISQWGSLTCGYGRFSLEHLSPITNLAGAGVIA